MEDIRIIDSKIYRVDVIGESNLVMDADLSIVCKDGKYGLMYASKYENENGCYRKELILACEYDNLFYIETGYALFLIPVSGGKQGLLCLEGSFCGYGEEIMVKKLLPCLYDRIEPGRENDILFLYNGAKISCYHHEEETIFTECEYVRELHNGWLSCVTGKKNELWDVVTPKLAAVLDSDIITYLGDCENGIVFLLTCLTEDGHITQQLLFCKHRCGVIGFGPKAASLSAHIKMERLSSPCVAGIEMDFGDGEDRLSMAAVAEITKVSQQPEEKG